MYLIVSLIIKIRLNFCWTAIPGNQCNHRMDLNGLESIQILINWLKFPSLAKFASSEQILFNQCFYRNNDVSVGRGERRAQQHC